MRLERDKPKRDDARLQHFLGFYSAGEGHVTGSIHSVVGDLRKLIFSRCIKTGQSNLYVTALICCTVAILTICFQNAKKLVM